MAAKSEYSQLQDRDADYNAIEDAPFLRSNGPARPYRLSSLTTFLLAYCTFTTGLILLAVVYKLTSPNAVCHKPNSDSSNVEAVFGRTAAYMSLDHKYDHFWEDVEGDASSIIFNISDAAPGIEGMSASISMFHQLHCLSIFRYVMQQAHAGIDPGLDWNDNDHWPHCFDYMRKTILCAADGTIEKQPVLPNGTIAPFIDGSQDIRHCGDNGRLIKQLKSYGKTVTAKPFP